MTRKIVQIAASESPEGGRSVLALCDDGTLWCSVSGSVRWLDWQPLPEIPQPEKLRPPGWAETPNGAVIPGLPTPPGVDA